MPGPMISEMTIDDYDDVIALWRADPGVGLSNADSREGIATYLRRTRACARWHERAVWSSVRFCAARRERSYITHLAVAEPHRREGTGRQLAECCIARLREHRIGKCHVMVFRESDEALVYWRSTGWVELYRPQGAIKTYLRFPVLRRRKKSPHNLWQGTDAVGRHFNQSISSSILTSRRTVFCCCWRRRRQRRRDPRKLAHRHGPVLRCQIDCKYAAASAGLTVLTSESIVHVIVPQHCCC